METKIVTLTLERAEALFPYTGSEGQGVYPTTEAQVIAHEVLGLTHMEDMNWHLPDVFAVRYGSCYIGTVTINGMKVRFVHDFGNWKEGDDK